MCQEGDDWEREGKRAGGRRRKGCLVLFDALLAEGQCVNDRAGRWRPGAEGEKRWGWLLVWERNRGNGEPWVCGRGVFGVLDVEMAEGKIVFGGRLLWLREGEVCLQGCWKMTLGGGSFRF